MNIDPQNYKLIMNYINDIFQFRTTFNHRLTNFEISILINQLHYNLDRECETYYGCESEILNDYDENMIHYCMIDAGFRVMKNETNNYIYNVSIKTHIQKLLKMHAEY